MSFLADEETFFGEQLKCRSSLQTLSETLRSLLSCSLTVLTNSSLLEAYFFRECSLVYRDCLSRSTSVRMFLTLVSSSLTLPVADSHLVTSSTTCTQRSMPALHFLTFMKTPHASLCSRLRDFSDNFSTRWFINHIRRYCCIKYRLKPACLQTKVDK